MPIVEGAGPTPPEVISRLALTWSSMPNTKFREILSITILVAFALLIGGYNEAIEYLSVIYKISDPTLYPNDLLSSFVSSGSYDVSFFFVTLAFVAKYVDLRIVTFAGYIITLIFFCLGIFYLAKSIFRNNYIAYLAVILLMLSKPGLAGGGTFWADFTHRDIAVVLAIFSVVYFIKSRYIYSFLLLGLAINVHIVLALPVLGFFIFDLIFKYRKLNTADKKGLFISLFLFALAVSPLFIFYSGSSSSLLSASFFSRADPQWLAIMQARFPHHISPHTWIVQISEYAPLLILPIISAIYLIRKKDYLDNLNVHKISLNLLFVFFIYVVIEIIFTEIIPWEPVMVLQLVRLSSFVTIFGIIYISYFIYELYVTALSERVITRTINYLLVSGLFVSIFGNDFKFAWVIIPLALTKVIPQRNHKMCYPLYFISFSLFIYSLLSQMSYYYTFVYCFCWFIALIGIDYIKQHNIITLVSRKSLLGLVLIVFLIVWPASSLVYRSLKTGQPLSEGVLTRVNIPYLTPTSYYKDIQLWANENTNVADIFLVPPYGNPGNESICIWGGFRTYSKRPIYGEWSWDGGFGFFNHALAFEWYERMNDLGIYTSGDLNKYKLLDETRVKELQRKYNISYAVFEKPKHLDFPIVYENKLFVVYEVM